MSVFLQPPRVPLVDERTGTISREWYRYFLDLQERAGGTNGTLVLAPTTSTENAIPRWDGASTLQDSSVTISDAGVMEGVTIVAASNTITTEASGGLVATELNAALAELQAEISAISTNPSIYAFAAAHG